MSFYEASSCYPQLSSLYRTVSGLVFQSRGGEPGTFDMEGRRAGILTGESRIDPNVIL